MANIAVSYMKHSLEDNIFLKTRPQTDDDYDFITSAGDDASNWRPK